MMMPTLAPVALPRCPLCRVPLDPQLVPPSVPATPPALNTLGYPGSHHLHLHCPVRVHFEKPREHTGASLCREPWNKLVYTPFSFAVLPRCPMCMGHPHLHPLHFQLPWRDIFCVQSPGTIAAHVCLSLIILPGHPLHGELWGLQACTHFNLNCPAIVLPAWRDTGPPSLHTA